MRPLAERVRRSFDACFTTHAQLRVALATAPRTEAAPLEGAAARARAVLGTGEAREMLEEAASTAQIDASSNAALLAHLAYVVQAEVLARRGLSLGLDREARRPIPVEGRERDPIELARELREHGRKDETAKLRALAAHLASDREARREALAEAEERSARVLARGPRGLDEAPEEMRERLTRFLTDTDEISRELAERVRHPAGVEGRGLLGLVRALSPLSLDPLVPAKGRARRLAALVDALGLDRELARGVRLVPSSRFALEPLVLTAGGPVTLVASGLELGLASEQAFLGALVSALTISLASGALPIEHRNPPLGTAALTLGALFEAALGEAPIASGLYRAGGRTEVQLRTCARASTLLSARLAAARALTTDRSAQAENETRERIAIVLGCDPGEVPVEVALPLRRSAREDEAEARARLAALALVPSLRERYDADFHRNPRLSDFLRGAAARGGTVTAEGLVTDAGGTLDDAARRARELAD